VIDRRIPFRCGFPRHGTLTLIIRSFMERVPLAHIPIAHIHSHRLVLRVFPLDHQSENFILNLPIGDVGYRSPSVLWLANRSYSIHQRIYLFALVMFIITFNSYNKMLKDFCFVADHNIYS